MEEEWLKVFDDTRRQIGVATRKEVHEKGLWHETFHCWIVSEEEVPVIYLQIRSPRKKDYPNLLDITAAGHLLSTENVKDGVREMEEEIGINVTIEDLTYLGILHYEMINGTLLDKEFAHTYLYKKTINEEAFLLQEEEVAGIVSATIDDFYALWNGTKETIEVRGFELNDKGEREEIQRVVDKADFAPHPLSYYVILIELLQENIS